MSGSKEHIIQKWKEFANGNPERTAVLNKVEEDLRAWLGSQERLLKSLRQRAIDNREIQSTIMILDARSKEISEFKKALFGE
ncbi:MAG TPA: hypothetical protein VFF30_04765 [Nitrososphaerales archaeon]|nr:hypothetical protein [Nitrososphaerales archaeon]